MTDRLTIDVPCVPLSGNRWQRMHYHKRTRINQDWHIWVLTMIRFRKEAQPFVMNAMQESPRRVRVSVTAYFAHGIRGKRLDEENLRTGLKPAWDAIVKCGLLRDDGVKYLEVGEVKQVIERDPKKHRTIFELELL